MTTMRTHQNTHTPFPWFYAYGAVWTTPDGPEDGGRCIAQRATGQEGGGIKPYVRDANMRLISMMPQFLALVEAAERGENTAEAAGRLMREYRSLCCEPLRHGIPGNTARDVNSQVDGPSRIKVTLTVPAGTRVRRLSDPSGGRWVVDEFTWLAQIAPKDSMTMHDATHYGITVPDDAVHA